MINIDEAWDNFCDGDYEVYENNMYTTESESTTNVKHIKDVKDKKYENKPKCTDMYISTKTKISYLNNNINLKKIFWELPIIPYYVQKEGIIKKQMKFNSMSQLELDEIKEKIDTNKNKYNAHVDEMIISNIVNPNGRIKYKDVRKISIGLSKKDIISYKCKKKGAFFNCFVVIVRKKIGNIFKEVHIKVFNTGKLEIPGIKDDNLLDDSLNLLINLLKNIDNYNTELKYLKEKNETVLINSNFSCGYYVNRNKLYKLLKYKYKINSVYDSCSYPGIQCEFYYKLNSIIQNGKKPINSKQNADNPCIKISFMIFRTGSVLIVGKCTEEILCVVYKFIKNLLSEEYEVIFEKNIINNDKNIVKRKRKKIIVINY